MAYTTYNFYTTEYYGEAVDSSSFPKWESRAEDKLNALCYGRIDSTVLQTYSTKIQKATCALIDILYLIDFSTKNAHDAKNGNIKIMSSGGQSVSFGENDTLISKVLSDKKAQERLMFDSICDYLADTGLLYGGM